MAPKAVQPTLDVERIKQYPGQLQVDRRVMVNAPGNFFRRQGCGDVDGGEVLLTWSGGEGVKPLLTLRMQESREPPRVAVPRLASCASPRLATCLATCLAVRLASRLAVFMLDVWNCTKWNQQLWG